MASPSEGAVKLAKLISILSVSDRELYQKYILQLSNSKDLDMAKKIASITFVDSSSNFSSGTADVLYQVALNLINSCINNEFTGIPSATRPELTLEDRAVLVNEMKVVLGASLEDLGKFLTEIQTFLSTADEATLFQFLKGTDDSLPEGI